MWKEDFKNYLKGLFNKDAEGNFVFVPEILKTFKNFYAEYLDAQNAEYLNARNKKKYLKVAFVVAFVVALVIIVFMIVHFTTGNKNKQIKDLDDTQKKGNGSADVKNPDSDNNGQTGQGNKENQKTGVFSNKIERRVAIGTAGASIGMGAASVASRLLANSKEKTNNSSVEDNKTGSRDLYTKGKKNDIGEDGEAQQHDLDVETSGQSDTGNKVSLVSGENKESETDTEDEKQESKEGYFVNIKEKAGIKNNESGDAEGKEKT